VRLTAWLYKHWYRSGFTYVTILLYPFSFIFGLIVSFRKYLYKHGWFRQTKFAVPVVVVGNLTVGGTGKTPMVIYLVDLLRQKGMTPGIVARGVGGRKQRLVRSVDFNSDPFEFGDEVVLLAKRTACPVRISVDRVAATRVLLDETNCDVVISDDGLQHYKLARTLEIILLDGMRKLGNKLLLPAGPLREKPNRLDDADIFFEKGRDFVLAGSKFCSLSDSKNVKSFNDFYGRQAHAVAGISNPVLFFDKLKQNNIKIIPHIFPDHYAFSVADVIFDDDFPVIMTEKDAVKCFEFDKLDNHWYLPVSVNLAKHLVDKLEKLLCKL